MQCTVVVPSAARPANTKAALARRSEAVTLAPLSCPTPVTVAAPPPDVMRAPMRFSSATC